MYDKALRAQKERVLCTDGSYTFYSKEFKEAYHSTKDGAFKESLEKHIKPAFSLKSHKESVTILDICFGLGYNTFTTLYYIKQHNIQTKVHILSPEFDEALVRSLDTFDFPLEFDIIKPIIKAISKDLYYEDAQCKIEILLGDARETIRGLTSDDLLRSNESSVGLTPKEKKIDIIYQDAFSPARNPLLWTYEWFRDIKALCTEDALLTTYSTAAAVRLGLHENGFLLYGYQGEGVRASMLASLRALKALEPIDMALKKMRNPTAKSLHDKAYQ